MEIQKFKEISTNVYNNIQSLTPVGIDVIKEILRLQKIKYGRIRTFSLEDSQTIILLTLKQNCLILIKFLLENSIQLPENLLDDVIDLLFINTTESSPVPGNIQPDQFAPQSTSQFGNTNNNIPHITVKKQGCTDLGAQIETDRIREQIFKGIIDIIYITSHSNEKLKNFLESRNVPDDASVNLAQIIHCEYKSFELIVLNKLFVGPVLLSLIESYRCKFRPAVKRRILDGLIKQIDSSDHSIIYRIFYLINDTERNDLLKRTKLENTSECLGFVHSLIVSKESAEIAHEKLLPFLDEFEYALSVLIGASKIEIKKVRSQDAELIEKVLECISKLIKYRSVCFYKFLQNFQSILKLDLGCKIKGILYDILCYYLSDRNVYVEKIVNCRVDIEKEFRKKEFFLLPRLIKFLNAYKRREDIETELLSQGKSIGSPYAQVYKIGTNEIPNGSQYVAQSHGVDSTDESLDYKMFGLKSEDPETVMECFNAYISPSVLGLSTFHIRNAMIKDSRVVEKVFQYQIAHKMIIDSISVINMILCTPNPDFFQYARLFNNFPFYLNGDVLERISDNTDEGIQWLSENYCSEVGRWILRNCNYFNDIIQSNEALQPKLLEIYDKILDENLGSVDILIRGTDSMVDDDVENVDTLLISGDENAVSDEFFRIFAKQLIYAKFYKDNDCTKFVLKDRYSHPAYVLYLKARVIAGFDILSDIKFMKAHLMDTDEILGYFSIVARDKVDLSELLPTNAKLSLNILLNFGIKDSFYFLENFNSASDLEKFILFFSLDEVNKEIDGIIKDEVMRHLRSQNKLYLRMCIIQLFKCTNLDNILKVLEKSFDDKELLFKLNIYNIATGGKYCSKSLIHQVDSSLMFQAIFLLYYMNIWEKEYLVELIERMDVELSDEIKHLKNDIKGY